ncbi:hypothetical protein [Streptomyces sp. NPDC059224]|uniref:hypothetical protein n=1 Tax=Streptomyces sp. NPDC059224 TaxID=3346775 RepID=UPI0036B3AA66
MSDEGYCTITGTAKPPTADGPPYATLERSRAWGSVLCREPAEYPESYEGITMCPAREWQKAQRSACSG